MAKLTKAMRTALVTDRFPFFMSYDGGISRTACRRNNDHGDSSSAAIARACAAAASSPSPAAAA
jgi:hypothetical protein